MEVLFLAMEQAAKLLFILDDDTSTLSALDRLLRKDFQVKIFQRSEDLFLALGLETPLIVISDATMPDINGIAVLEKVREQSPASVRVLLSGMINAEEIAPAISSGLIHRFIVKPWENQILRIQMHECLELHKTLSHSLALKDLSLTDAVTGLFNHRHFQDQINKEVDRAKRTSQPLTLLMIDLDNFKELNDRNGHPTGDKALQEVGKIFTQSLRSTDIVFRYGGDEFTILLPSTNAKSGFEIAERLRAAMASLPQSLVGATLSIGLATFPSVASSRDELIKKADSALYEAKNRGRNQSVIATE